MDFRSVAPDDIDLEDRTFEILAYQAPVRLQESLSRFGIADPLWLLQKSAGFIVVDGFKRLRWARGAGIKSLPCRVFPEDHPHHELRLLRIEKKLFEPDLNLAEKAQIIFCLLGLFPLEQPPSTFLAAMNVSSRHEILEKWASLGALEEAVLGVLATGEIAERAAISVSDWDRESRNAVLPILRSLRCSASIQLEIIERVDEIAVRENKSRLEILRCERVEAILADPELNHRRKTQALRDVLTLLRFPRLSERQHHFEKAIQVIAPPVPLRIIPPPSFEGDNWRMELVFSGRENLLKVLDSAVEMASSPRMDFLFHPPARASVDGDRE